MSWQQRSKLGKGKAAKAILEYLHRTERGTGAVVINDMIASVSRDPALRGKHYGEFQRAIDDLARREIVIESRDDIGQPTVMLAPHGHSGPVQPAQQRQMAPSVGFKVELLEDGRVTWKGWTAEFLDQEGLDPGDVARVLALQPGQSVTLDLGAGGSSTVRRPAMVDDATIWSFNTKTAQLERTKPAEDKKAQRRAEMLAKAEAAVEVARVKLEESEAVVAASSGKSKAKAQDARERAAMALVKAEQKLLCMQEVPS